MKSIKPATDRVSRRLQVIQPLPAQSQYPFQKDPVRFGNSTETHVFKRFRPMKPGTPAISLRDPSPCTSVQPRFISFQNFALCEIADPLQIPKARLGCRFICTTSGFAQKKNARPAGGRGISAFSIDFFVWPNISQRNIGLMCN